MNSSFHRLDEKAMVMLQLWGGSDREGVVGEKEKIYRIR